MDNREQSRKLRAKLQTEQKEQTQNAQASSVEKSLKDNALAKLQDELENTKLMLADANKTKDELVAQLDELQKERDGLATLVEEKEKTIQECKKEATEEIARLTNEHTKECEKKRQTKKR